MIERLVDDEKQIKKLLLKYRTRVNLKVLIIKVLAIVLVLYLVFTFILGIFRMSGLSMYPRIGDSDLVLYYRLANKYNVGDVIVLNEGSNTYTLRIIGIEGQTIDIDKDGNLMADNHVVNEKIFYKTFKSTNSKIKYPYKIPKGEYFVLGDFRMSSTDSRDFGSITKDQIKGKVINILRSRDL